tara:strand:- start:841 stop:1875 length:1035 start_codon:yes stop_codon:yes gene_type:complete
MIPRIRPVRLDDLDPLFALAQQTGFGLTTLPPEHKLLQRRIKESIQAFGQLVRKPTGQTYLFVLEVDGKVAGTTGIASKTGGFEPFYTYQLDSEHFESKTLGVAHDVQVLKPVAEHSGPGEVGSLFLAPSSQGLGLGGLLSRCRFLFMAEHPRFFEKTIVAELRGVIDEHGCSPFWDAIGAHFYGVDFQRADFQVLRGKEFIAELMPRHPIYVPTLPKAAQEVIGQVHPNTLPALKMLEREGFKPNGQIDIFEAGPTVCCEREQILTVRNSRVAELSKIANPAESAPKAILCNTEMEFRACYGTIEELAPDQIRVSPEVAEALETEVGDQIRFAIPPPKPPHAS